MQSTTWEMTSINPSRDEFYYQYQDMNSETTLTWNVLEEAFEIANISSITVDPQLAIATYKSADDPAQEGDNEISEEVWVDYTPPYPI